MTRRPVVPATCPVCGAASVAYIVYGMPGPDVHERFAPTPIALGGCVIWDDAPRWRCQACEHAWGRAFHGPAV